MIPTVWCALHDRYLEVRERGEETKLLGFYSTLGLAQNALAYLKTQPGFSDAPAGLRVVALPVNALHSTPVFHQSDDWYDPDPLAGTRSIDYLEYAGIAASHGGKVLSALFRQTKNKNDQSDLSLLGVFSDYHLAASHLEATTTSKAIETIQIFYELNEVLWPEGFVIRTLRKTMSLEASALV